MYYVMENSTDVIVSDTSQVTHNKRIGFKVVGYRKTIKGAERLAEKRCNA